MIKVQTITDPEDFMIDGAQISYPVSTQYMTYNPLTHRYYLTVESLEVNNIDYESYSDAVNKADDFIKEVTNDLYDLILDIAPFNYEYNTFLIASSRSYHFDHYTARKMFEDALIAQARYKMDNLDVRRVNGVDLENNNQIYHKVLRKEHRHISPIAIEKMKGLGLFFNGNIPYKYLINYKELM